MYKPTWFLLQTSKWSCMCLVHHQSHEQGVKLLAFRDTKKHCQKAIFLTRISDLKPCKNLGLGMPKLKHGFPSVTGKPERAAESQFLEVAPRKETMIVCS